jgi:hypothetical protein
MVVIKRVIDKKNKTIRVGAAEIEWLKLRIELLTAPDDFKKKTKLEMLNYCPHLEIIYSNYNEQEIIEDIGKEVFPHYEYGF